KTTKPRRWRGPLPGPPLGRGGSLLPKLCRIAPSPAKGRAGEGWLSQRESLPQLTVNADRHAAHGVPRAAHDVVPTFHGAPRASLSVSLPVLPSARWRFCSRFPHAVDAG